MVTRLVVLVAIFGMVSCGGGGTSDSSSAGGTGSTGGSGGSTGGGTVTVAVAPPGPQTASFYATFRTNKTLMLHEAALTPQFVHDSFATIDGSFSAWDGGFVQLPVNGTKVMSTTALDYGAVVNELNPLFSLKPAHFKYLFAVVPDQKVANDPFDDWTQVIKNWVTMARAVRDAGMVGIVFDNEILTGRQNSYPGDIKYPTLSEQEYQQQMRIRGKQIIAAVEAEFPDIVILFMRGPMGSDTRTPAQFLTTDPATVSLQGPFFIGMADGKGTRSWLVDGGNEYQERTDAQFANSILWRGTLFGSDQFYSQIVPTTVRNDKWTAAVTVAQGVRDLDGFEQVGDSYPIDLWTATLERAVASDARIVWTTFRKSGFEVVKDGASFVAGATQARAVAAGIGQLNPSTTVGTGTGLMAQYYLGVDYSTLYVTRVDAIIDYDWTDTGPTPSNLSDTSNYCVVWSGYVEAPTTGMYTFNGRTDDGVRITLGIPSTTTVNGVDVPSASTVVLDAFNYQGVDDRRSMPIMLTAGQRVPIEIDYFQGGGGAEAHILWSTDGGATETVIPKTAYYPY